MRSMGIMGRVGSGHMEQASNTHQYPKAFQKRRHGYYLKCVAGAANKAFRIFLLLIDWYCHTNDFQLFLQGHISRTLFKQPPHPICQCKDTRKVQKVAIKFIKGPRYVQHAAALHRCHRYQSVNQWRPRMLHFPRASQSCFKSPPTVTLCPSSSTRI